MFDLITLKNSEYCRKYCVGHGSIGLKKDPIKHDKYCRIPELMKMLTFPSDIERYYCYIYCKNHPIIQHVPSCPIMRKQEENSTGSKRNY